MNPSPVLAPWQQRAFDRAVDALDGGRMGHAMLLCGPARLGKRVVADRLASHLLGAGHDARAASLIAAGTHPDLLAVGLEPNREGTRMRTEIVIEQIRALTGKLSLTAQYGQARVAIVDPADAINHAAANALLKTLEEPQPGRYLWLVAAEPMRLPATIRSRCQRIEFRLPPRDEALAWLAARGHAAADAGEALDAAQGHAAVLLSGIDAAEAHFGRLLHHIDGEMLVLVPAGRMRRQLGLGEGTGRVLNGALIVGEGEVHESSRITACPLTGRSRRF